MQTRRLGNCYFLQVYFQEVRDSLWRIEIDRKSVKEHQLRALGHTPSIDEPQRDRDTPSEQNTDVIMPRAAKQRSELSPRRGFARVMTYD